MMRRPPVTPDPVGVGQESVWDYPRPPALVRSDRHVVVRLGDTLVAETRRAWRVLETSHPPTWYVPRADVATGVVVPSRTPSSHCEWKGAATYWDVVTPTARIEAAMWSYETPTASFAAMAGAMTGYPALLECRVDGERVAPQEGGFYGGWITADVVGPFKGGPGSRGW
jgi:uncharacterized protein (DUF427 family)